MPTELIKFVIADSAENIIQRFGRIPATGQQVLCVKCGAVLMIGPASRELIATGFTVLCFDCSGKLAVEHVKEGAEIVIMIPPRTGP